jgi:hypothetical protein
MRLARWGAQVGVAVLGVVAATTCQFSDVLTTPGVENVVLSYRGDTILVVGSAAIPSARAEVDGAALPRAQFQYASSTLPPIRPSSPCGRATPSSPNGAGRSRSP